jgi:signal transduction histidine kinase/CheY-like chemotaxis protein
MQHRLARIVLTPCFSHGGDRRRQRPVAITLSISSGTQAGRVVPLLVAALVAFSVLLPSALFAWTAAQDRTRALEEGRFTAERTVAALHEHALRALETSELLLRHLTSQIEGRSWDDIERDERLHRSIAHLVQASSNVDAISLVDAEGRVRLSSRSFPTGHESIAGRDDFLALSQGHGELVAGSATPSRYSDRWIFPLSLRRVGADGRFNGVLVVGIPLDYFTDFWRQFAPTVAHVIPMIRADGQLLVRHPATNNPPRLDPTAPFMQQIARAPSGLYTAVSRVDGVERVNAYTKIGSYPVYVSFSIETRALLANWRAGLVTPAWLTALAIAILLSLSTLLVRFVRRERLAVAKWRDNARRLSDEMDRREAAEEKLRQSQKMETIGQITGGVAHDFNNLLQILSNNLQLAARAPMDKRAAGFIASAIGAVERGAKLTQHLLAFSRRQPLSPASVDVQSMLRDMAPLIRTTVGVGIEIRIEPEPDTWPAMIDRNQAEMAILNLALNARDAMPVGGTLLVTASNTVVADGDESGSGLQAGEYVVIAVGDTGTGMEPHVVARACEPFFTTKEPGKGSGLGLSQVHGFAAQSGGTVKIDSDVARGTSVRLYLPRTRHPASQPALPVRHVRFTPTRTILLVDDDVEVRSGVAAALDAMGHSVVQAGSGQEALEHLRAHPETSLLLTDYAMPGMRGTQLAYEATKRQPSLKILLISGFADLPQDEMLRWDLLRKPFTPEELAACIDELLGRSAARSGQEAGVA